MRALIQELHTLASNMPKKGMSDYLLEREKRWNERIAALIFALADQKKALEKTLAAYEEDKRQCIELDALIASYEKKDYSAMKESAGKLLMMMQTMPDNTKMGFIPEAISAAINSDYNELQKCFSAGCYRSTVILCGRILETALLRKFFELTGKDISETAPGLGLGKLVAKLKEMNCDIGPGLTEQIHLINQLRINSVHQKQNAFEPTKEQAQATMLYTMDVVKKLFRQQA